MVMTTSLVVMVGAVVYGHYLAMDIISLKYTEVHAHTNVHRSTMHICSGTCTWPNAHMNVCTHKS